MIDRRYGKRLMQAFDYSDGVELVETMFAIRFEGVEMANEFKKEFERCQKESKKLYESADAAEAFVGQVCFNHSIRRYHTQLTNDHKLHQHHQQLDCRA